MEYIGLIIGFIIIICILTGAGFGGDIRIWRPYLVSRKLKPKINQQLKKHNFRVKRIDWILNHKENDLIVMTVFTTNLSKDNPFCETYGTVYYNTSTRTAYINFSAYIPDMDIKLGD